jgi:ribokinase
MKKPRLLVVGSFVMDLIVSTEKFPQSGETVLGKSFRTAPGGKGANQATQAARLGADVTMVGKVGEDGFGNELIASAKASGIRTDHVLRDSENASAIGNILLEVGGGKQSRNRIIVVSGANMNIQPEDIAFLEEDIKQFDMVLLQLEIPMQINEIVAGYAYRAGVPVMLNSAPSAPLSAQLLTQLAYICPNEHEIADLTGIVIKNEDGKPDMSSVNAAAKQLLSSGVKNVLVTLGAGGAALVNETGTIFSPSIPIAHVADPTAAGDSFIGAFCTAVCARFSPTEALAFANYAAAITVSRMGAQPSLPVLAEVADFIKKDPGSVVNIDQLFCD